MTLLGDAIHSMTPFRGIGANIALRDAALLRRELVAAACDEKPLLTAIHDYETAMVEYGSAAVRDSLKAAKQATMDNPVSPNVRSTMRGDERRHPFPSQGSRDVCVEFGSRQTTIMSRQRADVTVETGVGESDSPIHPPPYRKEPDDAKAGGV